MVTLNETPSNPTVSNTTTCLPSNLSEPLRRGTPLPLAQLVEEERDTVPNHLLQSKIYARLQNNSLIHAEPSALHFSGFDLGKDYQKVLKLINISSEVMNIHIIPTQTRYFLTTYTKKHRLIPGLAYTVKVQFCPDELRYFYDCVRVHCKGDENLLVPVHAYPVIDDLHIPSYINLPAIPVGQSVSHTIPLSCSCPIDFEFNVYVIQPHKAFTVQPLAGLIPANGKVDITVTFRPFQYETSQLTIQLVVSQFNTKPQLCTISGCSAPRLVNLERDVVAEENIGPLSAHLVAPLPKIKFRPTKRAEKPKTVRDLADSAYPGLKPPVDVSTHAGVAKMLLRDSGKLSSKDLKEAISCDNTAGLQSRQLKEVMFLKKVHQEVKEEDILRSRWQMHLGSDPVSEQTKRQISDQREMDLYEYNVVRRDGRQEEIFHTGPPKLASRRVLREARQVPEVVPAFQLYSSSHLMVRQEILKMFQQAARKVVIRCRMNRRLVCLRNLTVNMKKQFEVHEEVEERQELCAIKISSDKVMPFSFPVYPDKADQLVPESFASMPVDPVEVTVKTCTPFFKLQVPQHYKLMGYQPVSAWEASINYTPPSLAQPLRTGALDELLPVEITSMSSGPVEPRDIEAEKAPILTFTAPKALLQPALVNPFRIFNPAPGLQTFKQTPKYLESDSKYSLCPLPRYTVPKSNLRGIINPNTPRKFLDRKDVIKGVMTLENSNLSTLKCLSNLITLTSNCAPRRCAHYNTDILPERAPPPLTGLPDDMLGLVCEPSGQPEVHLTPEMIRAVFLDDEVLLSNLKKGLRARLLREGQVEEAYRSQINQAEKRVMGRLEQLRKAQGTD